MTYRELPLPDRMFFGEAEMLMRANAFYADIRRRHTVRAFSSRPVPREIIETCIQAAGTAPSGANHQPWHFAVVGNPAIKAQIRAAAEQEERQFYAGRAGEEWLGHLQPLGTDANKPFLEEAPWLIAVFGERSSLEDGQPRKNYYVPESVCIATGFLIAACIMPAWRHSPTRPTR
jgi:iodotyrosine deiodinase